MASARPIVLMLTAALGVTGCASALSGRGTLAADRSSSAVPTGFPSTAASVPISPPVSPPVSPVATAPTTADPPGVASLTLDQVDARLEKPPSGAVAWTTPWARSRHPTVRGFVQHVYPATYVAGEITRLQGQGLQDITHQTWYASDADQADMVLLRFTDADGALERFLAVTAAKAAAPGVRSYAVSANPYAVGYYRPQPDSLGNVVTIVYSRVANVVVEEFYFSPKVLRKADSVTWMTAQLRLLSH